MSSETTKWKVLIADADYAASMAEVTPKFPQMELVCANEQNSAAALASGEFVGVVAQGASVDKALLEKLSGVRVILKNGRSYHNIDVETARARKLMLAALPRKGPNCVAELATTLILALSKDLIVSHEAVATAAYRYRGIKPERTAERKIAFRWMHNERVHEIRGKTLGIVGMGEIGGELARRASVLGMKNLYYKRHPLSAELEQRFEASYRDLPALLAESDTVCIALPHTEESTKLIGAEQLNLMKPSAFLVNIARGGIIDEEALIEALRNNRIAGAGLDVFTFEPLQADSPLCHLDNVILTPHIGGGSGTTRAFELGEALTELQRVLTGGKPQIDFS